ncbi:NADH:flavin oxidoreductase/NADH oxidase [Leeia sp. TBRC 13508]|uniref:NADH:flavin oxidoreductase/NADH oxidase n=1 Tax=Leeia speluncae TaxID=2884804 RepID=A0ABS8D2G9_9NEIS|nr:NADH:flavin oxidoreductase/NADH oxidase [Leeia speluncae]MCB6182367.1 NADH:flavin oxidoreductase/NADH oxidase [Leeia speluncae]
MSVLFSPFELNGIKLRNRIAVPPMCQYSAVNGYTNDWHQTHYASIARGGAGLVIVEATAVSPEGRITPSCLGLWEDGQKEGLSIIASSIKKAGAVPGIQIAHAGRKACANRPWEGDDHIPSDAPEAWETIAPSAIPFGGGLNRTPRKMTLEDIERVKADFVAAARRAKESGFEWLELHFAHGYLAQSFFSDHSNQRVDHYGGSFENRARFILETLEAVRDIWPAKFALTARLGVIEYDGRDTETLEESIELARRMRVLGIDLLNVSVNFVIPDTHIPWGETAFLAPIAASVKREANIPVASSWGLDNPFVAQQVVESGQMDLVMIGRAMLANPHYPHLLAHALEIKHPDWTLPAPYAHWLERYRGAAQYPVRLLGDA